MINRPYHDFSQPDTEPRKSIANGQLTDAAKLEKLQSIIDRLKALVMIAKQKNEDTIDVSHEKKYACNQIFSEK